MQLFFQKLKYSFGLIDMCVDEFEFFEFLAFCEEFTKSEAGGCMGV
jgi:hypothetical protein